MSLLLVVHVLASGAMGGLDVYQYDPARHDRFYTGEDKAFVGEFLDLSGIGRRPDSSGPWATMVSGQYFVSANHWHPEAGGRLRFHHDNDPNGAWEEATVAGGMQIGYSDLWLGWLDAPVSEAVAKYPIYSVPPSELIGQEMHIVGQASTAYPNPQRMRMGRNELESVGTSFQWTYDTTGGLGQDEARTQPGDSGAPTFVVHNGQLALLGTHSSVNGDAYVPEYAQKLNEHMYDDPATLVGLPDGAPYGPFTWDGADPAGGDPGDGVSWSDPANWCGADGLDRGVTPGFDVTLPLHASGTTVDMQGDRTVHNLRVEGDYTLTGGALTMLGGSVYVSVEKTLDFEGSFAHAFTKKGPGELRAEGTLPDVVLHDGRLSGPVNAGAVKVTAGAELRVSGTVRSLDVTPAGKLELVLTGPPQWETPILAVEEGFIGEGTLIILVDEATTVLPGQRWKAMSWGSYDGPFYRIKGLDNVQGKEGLWLNYEQTDEGIYLTAEALAGDVDLDGTVGIADLSVMASIWQGEVDWCCGDLNGDGSVGLADLSLIASNWGNSIYSQSVSVPEPTTALLLAIMGAAALRRRPEAASSGRRTSR
ncbi:MAG: PEP-CTERM sorting domain-containing protein [Phycisphaerae bacterium]